MSDSIWTEKGGTLSDKSARGEFGLTQEEIIEAITSGELRYRENYIHGNPYFRLVRSEVEAFVDVKYGGNYLQKKKLEKELSVVNKALRKLKTNQVSLEKRKVELLDEIRNE